MENDPGLAAVRVRRFRGGAFAAVEDVAAVEEPLDVRLCSGGPARSVAITMRTPGRDADLALGFLFTEGVIMAGAQVRKTVAEGNVVTVHLDPATPIDWNRLARHSYTSSSCGVCGKTSLDQVYQALPFPSQPRSVQLDPALLPLLPDRLRASQRLFDRTGGIHAAGLFNLAGELLHFAEDVGRHNALDKVIGHAFGSGQLPLYDRILVLSGRASFELIQKAAMAGLPVVAAVGAPSSLAVELANDTGVVLAGFTSRRGFNLYGAG